MASRRALVTGITGQDGAYLSRLLLDRGYEVVGGVRQTAGNSLWRLKDVGVLDKIKLVALDLAEESNVLNVVEEERPSVIFNLASQSFVATSFRRPAYTGDINAIGVARLLDAIRNIDPGIRFYQASTSEMYGKAQETPQTETTPFYPRSPYGVAKLYGHWMTVNFREGFGIHASSGILFNHESPYRGKTFVTRKITSHMALMKTGYSEPIKLGNIDAKRDWGHARDYVKGMLAMVQADKPGDYVLATGVSRSVRDFATSAARAAGLDILWEGEGVNERAHDRKSGQLVAYIDASLYRPAEVDFVLGNSAKARSNLGWAPETPFDAMIEEMVKADYDRLRREEALF